MFEILFLCGVFALILGAAWEFVTSLAAFPTIVVAAAAVPLLAWADYLRLVQRLELAGLDRRRAPVPPERFYWTLGKGRLQRMLVWSGALTVAGWAAALSFPAGLGLTGADAAGWLAGSVAILATARFGAGATLYLRASQWFDRMAPWAVGFCRRSLYRISDNPDFLAPGHPDRREEEKSIY